VKFGSKLGLKRFWFELLVLTTVALNEHNLSSTTPIEVILARGESLFEELSVDRSHALIR
jgi:hypothetical protein